MRLAVFVILLMFAFFIILFVSGCLQQPRPNCIDKDNDGFGSANLQYCPSSEIDCDDANPNVHPGMAEKCNSIDDDCDGTIDEGCECIEGETKQCGYSDIGICKYGIQRCVNGSWSECEGAIMPQKETCENGIDEDCDGSDAPCSECGEVVLDRCRCGTEIVESGYCCNGVPSQTPCGSTSRDAIEILRTFPLEDNWQREELEECYYFGHITNTENLITSFLFINPELLCRYTPMYGWDTTSLVKAAFCVYKKGQAPDVYSFPRGAAPKVIETPNYTIYIFQPCTPEEFNNIPFMSRLISELENISGSSKT